LNVEGLRPWCHWRPRTALLSGAVRSAAMTRASRSNSTGRTTLSRCAVAGSGAEMLSDIEFGLAYCMYRSRSWIVLVPGNSWSEIESLIAPVPSSSFVSLSGTRSRHIEPVETEERLHPVRRLVCRRWRHGVDSQRSLLALELVHCFDPCPRHTPSVCLPAPPFHESEARHGHTLDDRHSIQCSQGCDLNPSRDRTCGTEAAAGISLQAQTFPS
jgi:hypothetical protein